MSRNGGDQPDEVSRLVAVVTRIVRSKIRDPQAADDVIQQSLLRVLESAPALDPASKLAYGIVVAQNEVRGYQRTAVRRRRLEPRLTDLRETEPPEAVVIAREEQNAVGQALAHLTEDERRLLIARDVADAPRRELAGQATEGSLGVRLSRARAKLRVEYLIAIHRARLPTPQCRSVLMALSAGDRRRQQRVGAGEHLLSCEPCAELSVPLLRRRRAPLVLVPFVAAAEAMRRAGRYARSHPAPAGAAAGVMAVAAVAAIAVSRPEAPPRLCGGTLVVAGRASTFEQLRASQEGDPVRVTAMPVAAVPADEGFWIDCGATRAWVQMMGSAESPVRVLANRRVSFEGRLVPHDSGFAAGVGVTDDEGGRDLDAAANHIEAERSAITLR